jgi:hypothetical protein
MADQQPGDTPAAAEPTRVGPGEAEPSTVDAPARWSGKATVPPPSAKRTWWSRRTPGLADEDDWATTPPQDPWAEQDTPWDTMPPVPEVIPPTRIDHPQMPPTRLEPLASPLPFAAPPPTAPPPPPRRRWRRKQKSAPPAPANRIPVAPRPLPPHPVQARPLPPPNWRPPNLHPPNQRPLPPPPRRRRRWPRNLALFTLFSVVCCCGIPACFAWPASRQYPVSAVLPQSVADLDLRDDGASRRAADRLAEQLSDANAFAGIYTDGNGKRVTIFGITGLRLTPKADVEATVRHLTNEYKIRDVQSFDVGEPGVHERCGVGKVSGSSVVVCAWADHGSLATVLLTRRSVTDSAKLTGTLRSAVLTRG